MRDVEGGEAHGAVRLDGVQGSAAGDVPAILPRDFDAQIFGEVIMATASMRKGFPDPDDLLTPRDPIDSTARRVVSAGEHFSGFQRDTEELCSPIPIPMREFISKDTLPDYRGVVSGKLTVLGLASIEHNSGYLNRDKLAIDKAKQRRALKAYKGRNPQKLPGKVTGGARWVCRCVCGNYTLRSTKGIRVNMSPSETPWRDWVDACVQCRELDKMRKGIGKYSNQPSNA